MESGVRKAGDFDKYEFFDWKDRLCCILIGILLAEVISNEIDRFRSNELSKLRQNAPITAPAQVEKPSKTPPYIENIRPQEGYN